MELYRRSYSSTSSSYEYCYYYSDELELFNCSLFQYVSEKKFSKLGTLFIDIFNNRDTYLRLVENIISSFSNFTSIDECFNYTHELYMEYVHRNENVLCFLLSSIQPIILSVKKKVENGQQKEFDISQLEEDKQFLNQILKLSKKYVVTAPIGSFISENTPKDDLKVFNKLYLLYEPSITLEEATINVKLNVELHEKNLSYYDNVIEYLSDNIKKYLDDLTSIFSNFDNYISSNDEKIKRYLLYTSKLPTYSYSIFLKIDNSYYEQPTYKLESLENNNYIDRALITKRYVFSDFIQLLDIFMEIYFQNKFVVLKCQNCGKYFMKTTRSDEKYCENVYKNNLTCREYAPSIRHRRKIEDNELQKTLYDFRNKVGARKRRAKNIHDKKEYEQFLSSFNTELSSKRSTLSEKQLLNWINSKKDVFDKKYSKNKK